MVGLRQYELGNNPMSENMQAQIELLAARALWRHFVLSSLSLTALANAIPLLQWSL